MAGQSNGNTQARPRVRGCKVNCRGERGNDVTVDEPPASTITRKTATERGEDQGATDTVP